MTGLHLTASVDGISLAAYRLIGRLFAALIHSHEFAFDLEISVTFPSARPQSDVKQQPDGGPWRSFGGPCPHGRLVSISFNADAVGPAACTDTDCPARRE